MSNMIIGVDRDCRARCNRTLFSCRSTEFCEVLETEEADSEAQVSGPVQYQCLDCLALFDSPETWLEHRRTHSRSSTHSNIETTVR